MRPRVERGQRRLPALLALLALPGSLLAAAGPAAAAAQEYRFEERSPAWIGISYETRWVQERGRCAPRVVVEHIIHGSPAERAGLRPGDAIVAINGQPGTRLGVLAGSLTPGDSVRLRFIRSGAAREVTAVADRRPRRPAAVAMAPGDAAGVLGSAAPVVRVSGDGIEVWNLEHGTGWAAGRGGYWLRRADGEMEYRRLDGWSSDEVDRQVVELLECADTVRTVAAPAAPAAPPAPVVDVRRIRRRADSLRLVIARRALDQMTIGAAFGGVAGAEITELEPELAEYFRGARRGLLVLRVVERSPAARAGLRPGDVITAVDGRSTSSMAALHRALARPDAQVELRIVRRGRSGTLTLRQD